MGKPHPSELRSRVVTTAAPMMMTCPLAPARLAHLRQSRQFGKVSGRNADLNIIVLRR